MRLNFKVIKRSAVALGFGAFLLLGAGATANAQEHHRSHGGAGFGHYSNYGSSYYGNDHAMRDQYQHSQRHGSYNGGYRSYGYGSYSPYASGGYYYPNYNNGYYGGYYNGGGYYNNYGYYGHRDSRNPVKRFFHHALGGH